MTLSKDYYLVDKSYMDRLLQSIDEMKSSLEATKGLSELDKAFVSLLTCTVTGTAQAAPVVFKRGKVVLDSHEELLDGYRQLTGFVK